MKSIICGIDYSRNSETALLYAYELAKSSNARLQVIHVFDYPTEAFRSAAEHIPRLQQFTLNTLGPEYLKQMVGITVLEANAVAEALTDTAREMQSDLLITGYRGESVLKELIMGKISSLLMKKTPCPLLIIPENHHWEPIKNLIYATDLEPEDIPAIMHLRELMHPLTPQIEVVHVSRFIRSETADMASFQEQLNQTVNHPQVQFRVLYADDLPFTLLQYFNKTHAQWVVMLDRKQTNVFKELLHRDQVKKMSPMTLVPVLVLKEEHYTSKSPHQTR